jgi:putative ABC transport system permease protein
MLLFASYEAHRRVGGFRNALLSITTSSGVVITSLLVFGIIEPTSRELIPIGGMLIGNSLNNYTIGVERIDREIELSKDRIEAYVAIGSTYREATHHLKIHSIKASLIPVINSLRTVGVVLIPGITTGMIIAGADPLSATTFQIVVMYMILSVALLTSIVGLSLRIQSSDLQSKPR